MLLSLTLVGALALGPGTGVSGDSLSAAALLRPTMSSVAAMQSAPPAAGGVAGPPGSAGPDSTGAKGDAPQLIEYSDAYFTRLTIHRWASYLTLPLFASEYVVGQKLMNGTDNNLRGVHRALAAGIGGLFVVNTITGGLNAIEAWKDPADRNRRTIHGTLMLLSDAGFVATAMLANRRDRNSQFGEFTRSNTLHKKVAIASMGTALLGYAIMLPLPWIGRH